MDGGFAGFQASVITAWASILLFILLEVSAVMSVITFIVYGADKLGAKINDPKKRHTRVPEKFLLTLAFIGGAWGAALGMLIFHHKTRKPRFRRLVPAACMIWTAVPLILFAVNWYYSRFLPY